MNCDITRGQARFINDDVEVETGHEIRVSSHGTREASRKGGRSQHRLMEGDRGKQDVGRLSGTSAPFVAKRDLGF